MANNFFAKLTRRLVFISVLLLIAFRFQGVGSAKEPHKEDINYKSNSPDTTSSAKIEAPVNKKYTSEERVQLEILNKKAAELFFEIIKCCNGNEVEISHYLSEINDIKDDISKQRGKWEIDKKGLNQRMKNLESLSKNIIKKMESTNKAFQKKLDIIKKSSEDLE